MIAKVAPCGSVSTENRPTSTSIGGTSTAAPSSCAFASDCSQSSTAKYTSQYVGTSAGTIGGIGSIPASVWPSNANSVYEPIGGPIWCVSLVQPKTVS